MLDIIGGLDAAQAAGILHRDIKPSNCFVDADGSVKVGDFGLSISTLARDVRHELVTDSGGFQGTPQFAPPEQLRGEPLDLRADVYAVGATLYYLLTGRPPFDDRDLHDLFARVASEAPASPRTIRREIPPGLASAVLQCLNKSPAGRPASYAVLADLLRPFARADEQPARLGVRFVAGLVDTMIVALFTVVWTGLTLDPIVRHEAAGRPPTGRGRSASPTSSSSKGRCMRRSASGCSDCVCRRRPENVTVTRVAIRAAIYYAPAILLFIVGAAFPDAMHAMLRAAHLQARQLHVQRQHPGSRPGHPHGLHISARAAPQRLGGRARSGEWYPSDRALGGGRAAMAHVSRARAAAVIPPPTALTGRRFGPFVVVSDAGETGGGRLFVAFDPVLRRPVWVLATPAGTPPISVARRDVSRRGRLYWLAGRRTDEESWDAFEAPDGAAFSRSSPVTLDWSALKLWLIDLANELTAAQRDGTLPALDPERLWIRNDGRLVLLDFAAPGAAVSEGRTRVAHTDRTARGGGALYNWCDPRPGRRSDAAVRAVAARSMVPRRADAAR